MAKPDFSSFTKEALLGILNALGISFPSQNNMEVSELAQIVSEAEQAVGEKVFAEAIAKTQGVSVDSTASQQSALQSRGGAVSARSINPGNSTQWTYFPAIGGLTSLTWDPPTPLEYGRTVA